MKLFKTLLPLVLTGTFSASLSAGVFTDDLSRCLVESSTAEDKQTLVVWMFTSISRHPAVQSMSAVTEEQFDASNKAAADMFVRLMSETCKAQSVKAIQYEGAAAIEQGFTVFGQVAGQELFAHPSVAEALGGLDEHIDEEKLEAALGM